MGFVLVSYSVSECNKNNTVSFKIYLFLKKYYFMYNNLLLSTSVLNLLPLHKFNSLNSN